MRRLSPSRRILASLLALFVASVTCEGQADHKCQLTVAAAQGDTCFSLAATWGISVTTFLNNNPTVSSCSKLNVGSNYCIDAEAPDAGGNNQQDLNPGELYVSTDGTCGGGITCKGSKWGDCCSGHGWCGGTPDHCGTECNPAFGVCAGGVSAAPPATSKAVTSAKPPASTPSRVNTQPVQPVDPGNNGVRVTSTVYETRYSTSVVMQTRFASLAITNTVYTSIVATSTRTALAVITTTAVVSAARSTLVVTSTRLDTSRVTRTMTQTEIDTSIITTITTLTLTVSGAAAADLCARISRSALINDARVPTPTPAGPLNNCMLPVLDARRC